jgi:hypothetical protein
LRDKLLLCAVIFGLKGTLIIINLFSHYGCNNNRFSPKSSSKYFVNRCQYVNNKLKIIILMTYLNNEKNASDPSEIAIKDIILKLREWGRYIRSKWKIVIIASFACAFLGFAYTYIKQPIYKAELTFVLQDENSSTGGLGSAAGLASQFGIDLGGSSMSGAFMGDNIIELLKSRSIIEKALLATVVINGKTQTLAELYLSFNKLRNHWEDNSLLKNIKFEPNADRSKFTLQEDSLLGTFYHSLLAKNLNVEKKDKKLNIIKIEMQSKDELFSKYFTEVIAKTVSDFYIETKTKKSVKNVAILQHQTDSVRQELNKAITGVAESADINPNSNPSLQILRVQSQHHQVDVGANTAILTELVKNLEISKVSLRKETPLIQVIDAPILPLEKEKMGHLTGILIGGILGLFLMVMFLLIGRIFKDVMN